MAFRRGFRRRRQRVQWLPNPGTARALAQGATVFEHWAGIEFGLTMLGADGNFPRVIESPLVVDNPTSATFTGSTLGVYQGTALNQTNEFGWKCHRIVGDMFFSHFAVVGEGAQTPWPAILVEAGIITRRVEGTDGRPLADSADEDPGSIENNDDPWVWRRNWILGSAVYAGNNFNWVQPTQAAVAQYPTTNIAYGSGLTGARVDQKTKRRIGPEERLFLNVTLTPLPMDITNPPISNTANTVELHFDYRVLGSVITVGGNRNNSSR